LGQVPQLEEAWFELFSRLSASFIQLEGPQYMPYTWSCSVFRTCLEASTPCDMHSDGLVIKINGTAEQELVHISKIEQFVQ